MPEAEREKSLLYADISSFQTAEGDWMLIGSNGVVARGFTSKRDADDYLLGESDDETSQG